MLKRSRPRKGAWIEMKSKKAPTSMAVSPPQGGVD